jgi:DNA-binding transcriptional regulator YdaS (Cro superfamily)
MTVCRKFIFQFMDARLRRSPRRALARIIRKEGSQVALARRLRCSQAIVSKWLTGKSRITPERAVALEERYPDVVTRADLRPDLWP